MSCCGHTPKDRRMFVMSPFTSRPATNAHPDVTGIIPVSMPIVVVCSSSSSSKARRRKATQSVQGREARQSNARRCNQRQQKQQKQQKQKQQQGKRTGISNLMKGYNTGKNGGAGGVNEFLGREAARAKRYVIPPKRNAISCNIAGGGGGGASRPATSPPRHTKAKKKRGDNVIIPRYFLSGELPVMSPLGPYTTETVYHHVDV